MKTTTLLKIVYSSSNCMRSTTLVREILEVLSDESAKGDQRWRRLSREVFHSSCPLTGLRSWFEAVCVFDETFGKSCRNLVDAPAGTVLVAGSGKDSFKTFNVSTAASLVAAAAGVKIVKGVSGPVPGESGSFKVLETLGVPVAERPQQVERYLRLGGIVFAHSRTFCPRFFDRCAGRFADVQATSLFMPLIALCVKGFAFLYGLSARHSELAARIIADIRPDLQRGTVVGAELLSGCIIDEYASRGTAWRSDWRNGALKYHETSKLEPELSWMYAISQRRSPVENARVLYHFLTDPQSSQVTNLVVDNAALLIELAFGISFSAARIRAEEVLTQGRAADLLRSFSKYK